jgi:hypothetical protein
VNKISKKQGSAHHVKKGNFTRYDDEVPVTAISSPALPGSGDKDMISAFQRKALLCSDALMHRIVCRAAPIGKLSIYIALRGKMFYKLRPELGYRRACLLYQEF